jgi:hypothetical protein
MICNEKEIELNQLNPQEMSEDEQRKTLVKSIAATDITLIPLLKGFTKEIILMKVDEIKLYEEAIKDLNEHKRNIRHLSEDDELWHEREITNYKKKINNVKEEIKSYEFVLNLLRQKTPMKFNDDGKPLSLKMILKVKDDKKESDIMFQVLHNELQNTIEQMNWDKKFIFNVWNETIGNNMFYRAGFFKIVQLLNDTITSHQNTLNLLVEKNDMYKRLEDFLNLFEKQDQGRKQSFVELYELQSKNTSSEQHIKK